MIAYRRPEEWRQAMYGDLMVSSWVMIGEDCPIRFDVGGSGSVTVLCGEDAADGFEFTLHSEALRRFLEKGSDALREMDEMCAREEAAEESGGRD
jgi:hypothetical protein